MTEHLSDPNTRIAMEASSEASFFTVVPVERLTAEKYCDDCFARRFGNGVLLCAREAYGMIPDEHRTPVVVISFAKAALGCADIKAVGGREPQHGIRPH